MVNKVIAAAAAVSVLCVLVLTVVVCCLIVQLLSVQPAMLAKVGLVTVIALFLSGTVGFLIGAVKR